VEKRLAGLLARLAPRIASLMNEQVAADNQN